MVGCTVLIQFGLYLLVFHSDLWLMCFLTASGLLGGKELDYDPENLRNFQNVKKLLKIWGDFGTI